MKCATCEVSHPSYDLYPGGAHGSQCINCVGRERDALENYIRMWVSPAPCVLSDLKRNAVLKRTIINATPNATATS